MTSVRQVRGAGGVLALLIAGFATFFVGPAAAAPPPTITSEVTENCDCLDDAAENKVRDAVGALADKNGIKLAVVYVDTFGDESPADWAGQITWDDAGDRPVLLAIATGTKQVYFDVFNAEIEGLSAAEITKIERNVVQPAVARGAWAEAATGAAQRLEDVAPESASYTLYVVIGVIVVLIVIGGSIGYSRYRRRREEQDALTGLREAEELTVDEMAAQPIDVLEQWSQEVLTDTDNAMRTSTEELELAIDEFGEARTREFITALGNARSALAASFALRQRLDDDFAETPDEQRSLLVQIITICSDADKALDEPVSSFDELRNLLIRASARLDEISRRIVELDALIPECQTALERLDDRFGPQALQAVADNTHLARELLRFAADSVDQGHESLTAEGDERGAAVADIRSAESALENAGRLIDAIEDAEHTLQRLDAAIPDLCTEIDSDIAVATGLLATAPDPRLAAAVDAARAAVAAAARSGEVEPMATFTALTGADLALLQALSTTPASSRLATRMPTLVAHVLRGMRARLNSAADFIATRRGAVQAIARTRLSEGRRLAAAADAEAVRSPEQAMEYARRADQLAADALTAALSDVDDWRDQRHDADGDPVAVLTGVLVDSFLRKSMRGGYTTGGRSPGSFGGSSTSGRIGTGERG